MILFLDVVAPCPRFVLIDNNKIIRSIHILDKNIIKISDNLIPKYLIRSNKFQQFFNSDVKEKNTDSESSKKNLKRLFFHPLGVNTSFVHEIFHFSEINWIKLFKQNGFQIVDKKNCPYFYSAYSVFRFKFLGLRKFFANIGFPSCYCFIMKRDTDISF